jgi:hypothetical protein
MYETVLQIDQIASYLSESLKFLNSNQGAFSLLLSLMLLVAYVAQYFSLKRQREIPQLI